MYKEKPLTGSSLRAKTYNVVSQLYMNFHYTFVNVECKIRKFRFQYVSTLDNIQLDF